MIFPTNVNIVVRDKIQINVGNSKYQIHEGLLRRDTKFFEIYEYGVFLNIDVGSEMFDSFAQWLYSRDIFKHPNGGVRVILELWFFAAKISCPELQNYAMDWIQDYHHSEDSMEESELRYVFETAKDGGGHKTLEDYCAAMLRQKSIEDFEMVCDFLQEVPVALSSYLYYEAVCEDIDQLRFDPTCRDKNHLCRFHIHNDDDMICESKPNV